MNAIGTAAKPAPSSSAVCSFSSLAVRNPAAAPIPPNEPATFQLKSPSIVLFLITSIPVKLNLLKIN